MITLCVLKCGFFDQIVSGDHRRQALACVHAGVGTVLAASKSTGYQDRGRVRECVGWLGSIVRKVCSHHMACQLRSRASAPLWVCVSVSCFNVDVDTEM